jgi:hypothetical protein
VDSTVGLGTGEGDDEEGEQSADDGEDDDAGLVNAYGEGRLDGDASLGPGAVAGWVWCGFLPGFNFGLQTCTGVRGCDDPVEAGEVVVVVSGGEVEFVFEVVPPAGLAGISPVLDLLVEFGRDGRVFGIHFDGLGGEVEMDGHLVAGLEGEEPASIGRAVCRVEGGGKGDDAFGGICGDDAVTDELKGLKVDRDWFGGDVLQGGGDVGG